MRIRDKPKQNVVELNALGVRELLDVLQGDFQLDGSLSLRHFTVENGGEILQQEGKTEKNSIEVPDRTQDLRLGAEELKPLVLAVHGGLELDFVFEVFLILLNEFQPEDIQ